MVQSFLVFSQESKSPIDTLIIKKDSISIDTIFPNILRPSSKAIEQKVTYSTSGYIRRDIINKKVYLVESAVVNYGETEIKADSIVFNMKTNLLFAIGRADTTGKIIGKPAFKEGSQEFTADELTYNFITRKALIKNIVTKQDDGLLHSAVTKLLEDGTSNISKSTYSTCDADTPHFYISLPRAKVYPGKKIVSGPGNLVVEGIPLPLYIPFGFFPVQTKRAASGILVPRFGEEKERGYYLTDGGYYFAISDYSDLSIKGSIYANGSWLSTVQTNYNKLYRYNGNFVFSYASNVAGHKGLEDYSQTANYRLGWAFNQDPKASPGSRLSASVNMSSSGYDRENSYTVAEHVTTQRQSSVSYSKTWEGTPFNLSTSMNHSQNVKNKTVALNLPKVSFNAGRITPFKSKKSTGPAKWYQEIQFQYSSQLDNRINTTDSLLFTKEVWNNMQNGFQHEAPLSFQIRPFRNFSISPALTYTGVLYTQKIEKVWKTDYFNEDIGQVVPTVVNDTIRGLTYGQALNPSINASFSPQIFGTYIFTNPEARLQSIRHVIKPSVGFSYVPYFSGLSSDMYRQVQVDTLGNTREYSIYESNIYGTPSKPSKSGNISFSLTNIIEGKVFEKQDTSGKPKKIKIIDNFGINTSYNIFADSLKWAPISMQVRTTILENFNISANGNFTLYGTDSNGRPIGEFLFSQKNQLMKLTNFGTSLDFSLSELFNKNKDKNKSGTQAPVNNIVNQNIRNVEGPGNPTQPGSGPSYFDLYGYRTFDLPWTLNVSYSFNYLNSEPKPTISQTLSFSGNASITKKTKISYTSGYDFTSKKITMTNIGIIRDLHCWEMNLNWVPNGTLQSWNFTIRVKASVLGDLKYERRKDFHDSY
jgi:hypothetical protein